VKKRRRLKEGGNIETKESELNKGKYPSLDRC